MVADRKKWCESKHVNVRVYNAWISMRQRCLNPNTKKYRHYGKRGITICKRWDSFGLFALDMGPHPGHGWTLEREDTHGNYEPENCVWATQATQQRNRTVTRLTEEAIQVIRATRYIRGNRWHPGNVKDISKKYGAAVRTIQDVWNYKTWIIEPEQRDAK